MRPDKLELNEVIKLIRDASYVGKYEITIVKPKDYVGLQLTLSRYDYKISFPNPDEMTISWEAPPFRASQAQKLANKWQLRTIF